MPPSFFRRYRLWIALLLVTSLPWAVWGAVRAMQSNSNNVVDWLPATFEQTQRNLWFYQHFGSDEMLMVSWPGCTVDDERLDRFEEALLPAGEAQTPSGGPALFRRIYTGRNVLAELTAPPARLSRTTALRRMHGWLVGPDGRASCAVLIVSEAGAADRHASVAAVYRAAQAHCGVAPDQLRLGGPTRDSVAIDEESVRSLHVLIALMGAVGLALCWWSLKSWRLVVIVFITAAVCDLWSLALVHFAGATMDSILTIMPAMVHILAISCCIHQLNYYRDEVERHGAAGAAVRALAKSWRPSLLANGTTALGLSSLIVSDVVPIRKFGIFGAVGMVLSVLLVFLLLPAALELWPPRRRSAKKGSTLPYGPPAVQTHSRWSTALAVASARHYRWVLAATAVALPVLCYGVSLTRTSVKLQDLFFEDAQVVQDYRWLEGHVGPLVPVETVLRFDRPCPMNMLEQMEFVERVRQAIDGISPVGGTISAATFAPAPPRPTGQRFSVARSVFNRKLDRNRGELIATHYLADGGDEDLWRISARVEALNDIDYGEFLGQVRGVVAPLVAQQAARRQCRIGSEFCGGVPLVYLVQRELMNDLISSFGAAFLMIALVLVVALRSVPAGLVTMLPNVFPVAVVFGVMGLAGFVVDLGSMMTISTALGISVDNELHFFAWYRSALEQGMPRQQALLATYRHCGAAMAQTAVICGLGMLTFAASSFVPTARFGWLMFLLITTAMAGDLVMLPALLASPLGGFFGRPKRATCSVPAPAMETPSAG